MRKEELWISRFLKLSVGAIIALALILIWLDKPLFYDLAGSCSYSFLWIREQFNSLSDPGNGWLIMLPFYLVTGCAILGMLVYPRPPRFLRVPAVSLLIILHTLYIVFRTSNTLQFHEIGSGILVLILWMAELLFYACSISLYIQLLFPTNRSPAADLHERAVKTGEFRPRVDVFVLTHSETVDMVKRTLVGCQAMEYGNKKIHLLDDGRRPRMRELAGQLGCEYITRERNEFAKAGNVNNGLQHTDGDLVAIFDADCVPSRNFLSRTAGFFRDKTVALVTTAQAFYNADMFAHNTMSLMEQSNFFRQSQCGRDRFNALLCFGTCFVVRRSAMMEIGGMPTETLSEDWATSIKLQAAGYTTYMLNEVLGAGTVAESMEEFIRQRIRWAQGTLQALFSSTNPLRIKGLSFTQRIIHSYGILYYLLNPFYMLLALLPMFYFLFGYTPFYVTEGQFWIIFMPFFVLSALVISWICREYTSKFSDIVSESFLCVPMTLTAISTMLKPHERKFRVTKKGIYRSGIKVNWLLAAPQAALMLLLVASVAYGYHSMKWYGSEALFYFIFAWSLLRIFSLWIGIYASVDFPQRRATMRFARELRCSLGNTREISGTIGDISESGFCFTADEPLKGLVPGTTDVAAIRELELKGVPVTITRVDGAKAAAAFTNIPLTTYRKLVDYLYCTPGQWEKESHLNQKVLSAFGNAVTFKTPDMAKAALILLILLSAWRVPACAAAADSKAVIPRSAERGTETVFPVSPEDFRDPQLSGLIAKMIAHNKDLRRMLATVRRLDAEFRVTRSALYPSAKVIATAGVFSDNPSLGDSGWNHQVSLPVSYEIDAWKRLNNFSAAALRESEAAARDREALCVTLAAELVERYYTGLCLENQANLYDQAMALANQTLELQKLRYDSGLISQDDVLKNEQKLREINTQRIAVKAELILQENALKVITGESPETGWIKGDFAIPEQLKEVPAAFPAYLVENRPDLRSLRLRIDAAAFRILATRRASYPSINLTGQAQTGSDQLNNLVTGTPASLGVFAQVSMPVFDGQKNKAAYEAEIAAKEELAEEHAQTLLEAFSEVETALSGGRQQRDTVQALRERSDSKAKEVGLIQLQYDQGLKNLVTLTAAKQELILDEIEYLSAELKLLSYRVQLLRSLSHAWWK